MPIERVFNDIKTEKQYNYGSNISFTDPESESTYYYVKMRSESHPQLKECADRRVYFNLDKKKLWVACVDDQYTLMHEAQDHLYVIENQAIKKTPLQ